MCGGDGKRLQLNAPKRCSWTLWLWQPSSICSSEAAFNARASTSCILHPIESSEKERIQQLMTFQGCRVSTKQPKQVTLPKPLGFRLVTFACKLILSSL